MDWRPRITAEPGVAHGRAHVRGTRIPVSVILDSLVAGLSFEQIVADYPSLKVEDVRAAIAYAAEITRQVPGGS